MNRMRRIRLHGGSRREQAMQATRVANLLQAFCHIAQTHPAGPLLGVAAKPARLVVEPPASFRPGAASSACSNSSSALDTSYQRLGVGLHKGGVQHCTTGVLALMLIDQLMRKACMKGCRWHTDGYVAEAAARSPQTMHMMLTNTQGKAAQ